MKRILSIISAISIMVISSSLFTGCNVTDFMPNNNLSAETAVEVTSNVSDNAITTVAATAATAAATKTTAKATTVAATKTSPATTSAKDNKSKSNSNKPAFLVKEITVPTDFNSLRVSKGEWEGMTVWNFKDHITRGVLDTTNATSASVSIVDFEAYYGLTAYTDDHAIYVKAYNHSNKHDIKSSNIIRYDGARQNITIGYDEYYKLELKTAYNGLYAFETEFDTKTVPLYFYVNNNTPYCVRATSTVSVCDRYATINAYVDKHNVKPEDCLNNSNIYYPCPDSEGHRCDTQKWIGLAHDLLDDHPDWSDEMKIFRLTEWMAQNIAYDDWRKNNGCSRAMQYGVWDGTYSMWDMKIGVCCDFTNVMVIMLREFNIPTTSIETDTHVWNLIYLDGMWHELDITTIIPYHSYQQNGKDRVYEKGTYHDYMTSNIGLIDWEDVGRDIYDDDFWD